MNKKLALTFGLVLSANAETIVVEKGWNLFGSVVSTDLNKTFSEYPQINLVWLYENSSKNWQVYGNNQIYKDKIAQTTYEQVSKVDRKLGFWVLNNGEKIEIELKEEINSTVNNNLLNRKFLNVEANFTRSGNVVTDHVSGLKWEDQSTVFYGNFSQAEAYCESLELDGITDWRVPSLKELWYLADRNYSNPAINPIFKNVKSDDYWSNQQVNYYGGGSIDWRIYFANWTVDFSNGYNGFNPKANLFNTKCVSGESHYEDINYYRDDNKNLVTDNPNSLMWQDQTSANSMNLNSAQTYCSELSFGGYSDWRLPNISELYSITDQRKTTVPFKNINFKNINSSSFWSSTITETYNANVWFVGFNNGDDYWNSQADFHFAVCVRDIK